MMHRPASRPVSLYAYPESTDTEDSFDFDFDQVKSELTAPLETSIKVVYWPCNYSDMPNNSRHRGTWFLQQVSLSCTSQPGAFITPNIFIPRELWDMKVKGAAARQLCLRAAFITSLSRTIQEMKYTSKLTYALKRKIAELWDSSLLPKVPDSKWAMHGPPSPPITEFDELPGPVRIHRSTKSRIKSLVHRTSLSPPQSDYLFHLGHEGALQKYSAAITSLVDALALSDDQWLDFVVFELASDIGCDMLDIHQIYMTEMKRILLL